MNEQQGQLIGDESAASTRAAAPGQGGHATAGRIAVRDLSPGAVESVYRLDQVDQRDTKTGKPYLRLTFGDATGAVPAVMWDGVAEVTAFCKTGAVVAVQGKYEINERYGPQLTVRSLRPAAEGEFEPADLEETPLFAYDDLARDFAALVESVEQPHLAELLRRLLGPETATGRAFMSMPAAKKNHQAYEHGLLEHTLTVAQAVSEGARIFPGVNRDLAVTGALLHDIGKLDAYAQNEGGIDITDAGKLQSEIPLGYYRIKREIEEIEGFEPTLAQALLHIQLSHHGKLEHGSPVEPATREAVLVSMMDHLGGTLGTYDRLEKGLPAGVDWSQFDRAVGDKGGSAYFGHTPGIRGDV